MEQGHNMVVDSSSMEQEPGSMVATSSRVWTG